MNTFVIIAGGDLSDETSIKLSGNEKVICADKGYEYALRLGIVPDTLVGDFDSYEGELPEDTEIIRSVPEKDDTDTLLAVKTAIARGADNIVIYGALGGRLDHTVANLQTLVYISEHGCKGRLESSGNSAELVCKGTHIFPKVENKYLSVFAVGGDMLIKELSGVKYPLYDYNMTVGFPIGVSNEIISSEALLVIESGMGLVIRSEM